MKQIVLDIYEITDEEMKEQNLIYKKRVKTYCYDTEKIMDFALDEYKQHWKIGQIIEQEAKQCLKI